MNRPPGKALVVVVAKEPLPGLVKTRFSPEITPVEAAGIYRCMIEDKTEEVRRLDGIDLAVAFTPEHALGAFASLCGKGFALFAQKGRDLGERLHNIFLDRLGAGYDAVAIIDSDSPDLPGTIVEEGLALLLEGTADAVFGPCLDGGYYLVGLRRPHPELFEEIPWSTPAVLETTLAKAREIGLRPALLTRWNDLDTFADLAEFYRRNKIAGEGEPRRGGKTLAFLAGLEKITRHIPGTPALKPR